MDRLLKRLFRYRDIVVEGLLYMTRWFLTPRSWSRRLFLHHIILPDKGRDLHCHPWNFWTLRLWGWYEEEVGASICARHRIPLTSGCLACSSMHAQHVERTGWRPRWRRAEHVHRVAKVSRGGCWTLVLVSQARRQWGFWQRDGWHSAESLGIKSETEDNVRA